MERNRNIAIMMTVHKNNIQVNRLINHLSKDFDVYVHIDKRSLLEINETEHVFVYKKYKLYWGSFNQIMATLFLLEQAHDKGYQRYLLISGQDLPIKSNKEIIRFFEGNHKEYISGNKMPIADMKGHGGLDRMTKYWANCRVNSNFFINLLYKIDRPFFHLISSIKPRPVDYIFFKGTNWINFTHSCVEKILEYLNNNPQYIKRFKWTKCADEIFYQTLLNLLEGLEVENENLRYVNWIDGPEFPRTLRTVDYEKIICSDKLFARKFDDTIDGEIIEKIYRKIDDK